MANIFHRFIVKSMDNAASLFTRFKLAVAIFISCLQLIIFLILYQLLIFDFNLLHTWFIKNNCFFFDVLHIKIHDIRNFTSNLLKGRI
jgi:hypothetical protein